VLNETLLCIVAFDAKTTKCAITLPNGHICWCA